MPGAASAAPIPQETSRVIVLLAMVAFGSAMSLRITDAALPRLASDFAIGIPQAAWVVTAFAIAYGCLQVVFGPAGDRYGKLRVIDVACLCATVASAACALAPTFPTLVAARVLAGASAASMMPLSMAWIGDRVPYAQRQPVLARFLMGQMIGIALGQAVGGIAADVSTWRLPFWLLAAWFAAMGLVLRRHAVAEPATRRDEAPAGLVAQGRSVLAVPWARQILFLVFVEGAALYGTFAFFATHLHVKHGLALGHAGSVVVAFAVGGMGYAIGAGRLLGRLGETGLARGGALLMAAGIAVLGLVPAGWPVGVFAIPALLASGLGFYMLHNTLQMNATQMAPNVRGTSVALFASCFFLGQATGVALGGHVVEGVGTTSWLVLGSATLVIVGWTFAGLRERHARRSTAVP